MIAVAYFRDFLAVMVIIFGLAIAGVFTMCFGGAMCQGCYHPVTGLPWQKHVCGWCQIMRHRIPHLDEKLKEQGL